MGFEPKLTASQKDDGGWVYQLYAKKTKKDNPATAGNARQNPLAGISQSADQVGSVPNGLGTNAARVSSSDTRVQQNGTGVNPYSMQDGAQFDIAPRQFGSKTVQRADAISDQVKQLLEGDTYETITNDAMIRQANERVDRDGIDSVTRELAGKANWTPEDTASALVALVRASSEEKAA